MSTPAPSPAPAPLSPAEVEAILADADRRSTVADLRATRDAVLRLADAWARAAVAAAELERVARAATARRPDHAPDQAPDHARTQGPDDRPAR